MYIANFCFCNSMYFACTWTDYVACLKTCSQTTIDKLVVGCPKLNFELYSGTPKETPE